MHAYYNFPSPQKTNKQTRRGVEYIYSMPNNLGVWSLSSQLYTIVGMTGPPVTSD